MGEADDLLGMAREELDQVQLMAESGIVERKRWSSLYYAMFYAAKAALLALDFEPRTHRGVNTLLGKELSGAAARRQGARELLLGDETPTGGSRLQSVCGPARTKPGSRY